MLDGSVALPFGSGLVKILELKRFPVKKIGGLCESITQALLLTGWLCSGAFIGVINLLHLEV